MEVKVFALPKRLLTRYAYYIDNKGRVLYESDIDDPIRESCPVCKEALEKGDAIVVNSKTHETVACVDCIEKVPLADLWKAYNEGDEANAQKRTYNETKNGA